MSAQALADACAAFNFPIGRGTIAKLENGGRESIGVHELVVIAAALGVPPVDLLFPGALETRHLNERAEEVPEPTVEYFPGDTIAGRTAWQRFVGPDGGPQRVRLAEAHYLSEQVTRLIREAQDDRG